MTEHDDVSMAGPRLAVRVAELMRLAAAGSDRTQSEIAERMGVGESRVSQIINGDGNFHVATIARFFAATDRNVDLRVFDSNDREVEIRRRRKPRRGGGGTTYVHPVETPEGEIARVFSFSRQRVEGKAIDYPMVVDTSIEYDLDKSSVFAYRSDVAGV